MAKQEKNRLNMIIVIAAVTVLGLVAVYQQCEIYQLDKSQKILQNDLLSAKKQMKKVYVYDLEETLRSVQLDELNREFEAKINILNDEVSIAQKKISSLKETKDKDDFSDVYLKSLKLKRDTMIHEYNRTLENLTENVNKVIAEIAKEKGASVVFDKRFISVQTDNVEDVTAEVIKRVKLPRPKILDE
ncbi:MAG: OmpH family outer membrane protein [Alphaproteobacteria bacterium]|nr:OmpH family outer membrane protein [Alphaproteobacteria bacterium]